LITKFIKIAKFIKIVLPCSETAMKILWWQRKEKHEEHRALPPSFLVTRKMNSEEIGHARFAVQGSSAEWGAPSQLPGSASKTEARYGLDFHPNQYKTTNAPVTYT
jgi:hypothetical protein